MVQRSPSTSRCAEVPVVLRLKMWKSRGSANLTNRDEIGSLIMRKGMEPLISRASAPSWGTRHERFVKSMM